MNSKIEGKKTTPIIDWFIRLIKGVIVGIGFILPGLSGGVLAVILGIYDLLIRFLSDLKKHFIENVLYFIPVIIGGAIGIVLFSILVEKLLAYMRPNLSVYLSDLWQELSLRYTKRREKKVDHGAICLYFYFRQHLFFF